MNIVQLHDVVYNWLDRVGSPRFDTDRVDGAMNGVIDQIIEENYDRLSGDPMLYFESNSKTRAILANLVKTFYNSRYLKLIATGSTGTPVSGKIVFRYGNDFQTLSPPDYDAAEIRDTIQAFDLIGDTTVTGNWTTGFHIVLTKEDTDPENENWYDKLEIDSSTTLADATGALIVPQIVRDYNSSRASASSLSYDPYFIRRDELPENIRYIVSFKIDIEGDNYFLKNITKIDKNELFQNPYKEPTLDYPERQFYDEIYDGIMLYCGSDDTIYGFEMVYIKNPELVSYGTEHSSSGTGITDPTSGIVVTATATIDSVGYVFGDEVTFTSTTLTAGTVVYGFINPDLGNQVHQDIAFRTAIALLIKIGETEKASLLLGLKN